MSVFMRSAIVYLLLTAGASADALTGLGILPFGYPIELGAGAPPAGNILSTNELIECARRAKELGQTRQGLDFAVTLLELNEPTKQPSAKNSTGDPELDKLLDEREAAEPSFDEMVREFIVRRHRYIIDRIAFDQQCSTRPYRIEDVRALLVGKKV